VVDTRQSDGCVRVCVAAFSLACSGLLAMTYITRDAPDTDGMMQRYSFM
jgi:hypothetical protein